MTRPRARPRPAPVVPGVAAWCTRHPHRAVLVTAGISVAAGWTIEGPIAAALAGAYATLAARAVLRRSRHHRRAAAHARTLDALCALAADLRAGLPPPQPALVQTSPSPTFPSWTVSSPPVSSPPVPAPTVGSPPVSASTVSASTVASSTVPPGEPDDVRLGNLVAAVWRLAERTGAPAADLVERIEADARAADRSRASAAAEAAGAKATAVLLAGLPAGGMALGYGIGVDPLQVLLHTPLGAACAAGTVILQAAGLAWTDRLARGPTR